MNSTHIPLLDLQAQYRTIGDSIEKAISRVINRAHFVMGEESVSFEKEFAAFCEVPYCVSCANGTDALTLALQAVGVMPGDEVITAANTFIATSEAISSVGAKPVFVDVSEDTLLMDIADARKKITSKTKALLPVHLYGQMVDMASWMQLANEYNLKVVEDAAQAHGARFCGQRAGSCGDIAAFSFYPGKNLGAYGDAGAITTKDVHAAEWIKKARNHGRITKYEHQFEGRNSRMDEIQAAVLRVKLTHLDEWNARRRHLATIYQNKLNGLPNVQFITTAENSLPVYHLLVVKLPNREKIMNRLRERGIESGIHYPIPLPLQPAYQKKGVSREGFPVSERAAKSIISLPIYPELSERNVDIVVTALANALEN